MSVRSERVETAALLRGEPGLANGTPPEVRLAERERVREFWPDDLLGPVEGEAIVAPPWRLLLDPTGWEGERDDVVSFVRWYLAFHGRWPSLDGLRRKFGRVSNHRGPDEVPEQGSLL